jgi:hypothetical protein
MLPTADEARMFVADKSSDKRSRLIDDLLARRIRRALGTKWADVMRSERRCSMRPASMRSIRGFAIGSPPANDGPVRSRADFGKRQHVSESAGQLYRANRDPATRGETAARLFLGVRLQCARCHNHPYDRWTQDDYYSWAAVFGRIDYQILANQRKDRLDKNEFNGEQVVLITSEGEFKNARTGLDAEPKFLGGYAPAIHPSEDRLQPLASWLGSANNELFVKSQSNFVWYHLLGRGLVEPIDDFRVTNPASNLPLLDALARDYAASDFNLRRLVRTIMNSRTYQLAAEPNETNRDDDGSFARAIVRRLPAETLLDAQMQVLDVAAEFNGYPAGTRAGQSAAIRVRLRDRKRRPPTVPETFANLSGCSPANASAPNETTLKQAFTLIGDERAEQLLAAEDSRLATRFKSDRSALDSLVGELY